MIARYDTARYFAQEILKTMCSIEDITGKMFEE